MDTSEQYIKMCDCPEVQKNRVGTEHFLWLECGDWFWRKNRNIIVCTSGRVGQGHRRKVSVWLPRQDQVQEMVDGSWVIAFESFDEWYFNKSYPQETYPNDVFMSMEQMWLAFYMYEKHKKVWDGKKWKR